MDHYTRLFRAASRLRALGDPPVDASGHRIEHSGVGGAGNHSDDVKKTKLKPNLKKQWCIPAKTGSEFVARMEDILETYVPPYNPEVPLICMDEQPVQLLDHSRPPEPMKLGKVCREDYNEKQPYGK